jgi:succinate dehydrogenase / fumarate reductase flavoprotein subunit
LELLLCKVRRIFRIPYTIADYLSADIRTGAIPTDSAEFEAMKKN